MLPSPPEWRWLERGDTTPWYPTATLFRQSKTGDWKSVVERVAAKLRELVVSKKPEVKL
jgi:hypothetical protein